MTDLQFDPECRRCPRLAGYLEETSNRFPGYHAAPVPPFGSKTPGLLIVGLAPGLHGANATGRPFTGDHAGILLYQTLFEFGFSTAPRSTSADDTLQLIDCRITNAVKCVPPQNKPTTQETRTCNGFLAQELESLREGAIILALGGIAHQSVLRAFNLRLGEHRFSHGGLHTMPGNRRLLDSYHCSRYNTQTRRLTTEMFQDVFRTARHLVDESL